MTKSEFKEYQKSFKVLWNKFLRPFVIIAASIIIVYFVLSKAYLYIANNYILPPEPGSTELVSVEIPSGSGVRTIARILEENNIISNATAFRIFVDLSNNSYKLQAGRYQFTRSMTMQEVMEQLLMHTSTVDTTTITIPEGWSVARIARYLTDSPEDGGKGFTSFTYDEFIEYAKPENFTEYSFIQMIPEERRDDTYALQGYLFPDTYFVYVDSSPEDIIKRMLDNFQVQVTDEIIEQAESLGYTLDELITFASIVEKESGAGEYARVAAVFTNRFDAGMNMEACSTVIYALALQNETRNNSFEVSIQDTQIDSPYNTYINSGLPIGPISNPGLAAIKAVIEPDEDDIRNNMLYFTLDPETNTHAFNSSYAQHVADSQRFAQKYQEMQQGS